MDGVVKDVIDARTVVVLIESKIRHPLYGKVLKRVKKLLVHVPEGRMTKVGDKVELSYSKPISKTKKWILK